MGVVVVVIVVDVVDVDVVVVVVVVHLEQPEEEGWVVEDKSIYIHLTALLLAL